MNTITRYGATLITSAAILAGAAGQADAKPQPPHLRAAGPFVSHFADRGERELHPYAKGSFRGPSRSLRMIPTRGSDGTNALCRSGSKAARWGC